MDSSVAETGVQQQYLLQDLEVKRSVGQIHVEVPAGHQCLLFKDGTLFKTLSEGRHSFSDFSLFGPKYTAKMVDAREHAFGPIAVSAELRDAENLVVPVELVLTVNVRLRDIQTFREAVDPYTKLRAMIPNQVATIMARLQYKEGAPWYLEVRDELERFLMTYSVQTTGLAVTSVLIANRPKDDAASRRFTMEDKLAERRRGSQLADAEVQRTIKGENLVSMAGAAAQASAAASSSEAAALLASQLEGGDQLLNRDIELRRLEAATGAQMRVTPLEPQQPQQPQLSPGYGGPGTPPALGSGYSGPDSTSNTYTFTPSADEGGTTGQSGAPSQSGGSVTAPFPVQSASFQERSPITGQFRPDMGPLGSTPAAAGQIDHQRLAEEVQRLTDAGYTAHFDQQRKTVAANRADGTLAIMFYLDADYPITAPSQIMVNRARSGWQGFQSTVATQWGPAHWLSEIASEVASVSA